MHCVYTVLSLMLTGSALAQDSRQTCSTCRPKSQCAWALTSRSQAGGFLCDLPGGGEGFCCSDILARPKEVRQSILTFRYFWKKNNKKNNHKANNDNNHLQYLTSSLAPPTRLPVQVATRIPSPTSSPIVPKITGCKSQGLDGTVSSEIGGFRLYKKSKKEFQGLIDYARKLLHYEA
eukprot:TRINITY_DN16480_c0_g1_i2.p1 TRINITY_DN16480_c0_g1~~TRINITY_DN16480_c0_g1_i2.p1  ORF type:complete len:177 (-),score=42.59 TRINITY_DN16480_c0_g1_i2:134-664(-)